VEQYLRARQVPVALGERVRNYYEYLWHRHHGLDEAGLLRDLPRSLRLDILLHLARDILQHVPLFRDCSPLLRDILVTALAPATYAPGDYLARQGEAGQEIVFITRGEAEILGDEPRKPVATLGPGDYFGHLSLALREQRSVSVRAKGYCEALILSQEDYANITADYPEFREVMKRVAAERSEQASALLLQGVVL
jgi:CRP-like cAMP-binding protein